ncbi:MAG TPA: class I SAM-dependent methyltransferase, partial [Xanthomonadales bacterium]|nr:class I SAM-dependent methyltransferase [Xanthomonadales bacterium]
MGLLHRKKTMAESADRHELYQMSVQDAETEISFILDTWNELRERPAEVLREDFCGTALAACEWVRRDGSHYAIAIDIDNEVLEWGRENNAIHLSLEQQQRLEMIEASVLEVDAGLADIALAMNFSYWLFRERPALLEYFRTVHEGLVDDGIFFLDAYGGYDAPRELEEPREVDGFTYIWDQASFNPIDSHMTCHIHFEFTDGSRLEQAFSYHWRLWTLPEIRELLF